MLKPSAELFTSPDVNSYSIVVAVAKRAREIASDAEKGGEILDEKPVDLAVQDFINRKYRIVRPVPKPNASLEH